jgi:hypothetical protein
VTTATNREKEAARLPPSRPDPEQSSPALTGRRTIVTARKILPIAAAATACATLSACGGTGAVGRLGELKRVARTCPAHDDVAAYVAWDVRRTLRRSRITAARLESLDRTAKRVAACGGRLRVVAFGPTAASTARLYDGELRPLGATENARLLRVPHLVDQVRDHVRQQLPVVLAEVSGQGADPVSQLAAAEQYGRQLGPGYTLRVVIATSGFGQDVPGSSSQLAANASVPDLSGADVVVAGLGKVGRGAPTPTPVVEELRAVYAQLCRRTHARTCLAITDLAPLGG